MVVKLLLLVVLLAGLLVGAARFLPSIKNKLQTQNITPHLSGNTLVLSGEASPAPEQSQNRILSAVTGVTGQIGAILGAATKTGGSLLGTITSSPANSGDIVDVGKVTADIASRVETIPSTVLQQAKVAYCQQVLLQATASAAVQQ